VVAGECDHTLLERTRRTFPALAHRRIGSGAA